MLRQALRVSVRNINSIEKASAVSSVSRSVVGRGFSSKRIAIEGNEAAARSIYNVAEAAMLFPITPSSTVGELCDAWAVQGKKNIFGQPVSVTQMQVYLVAGLLRVESAAGAPGALHGALLGGVLATTFSSSQGLMLMVPNMYVSARPSHSVGTVLVVNSSPVSSTSPPVPSPRAVPACTATTVMSSPPVSYVAPRVHDL